MSNARPRVHLGAFGYVNLYRIRMKKLKDQNSTNGLQNKANTHIAGCHSCEGVEGVLQLQRSLLCPRRDWHTVLSIIIKPSLSCPYLTKTCLSPTYSCQYGCYTKFLSAFGNTSLSYYALFLAK